MLAWLRRNIHASANARCDAPRGGRDRERMIVCMVVVSLLDNPGLSTPWNCARIKKLKQMPRDGTAWPRYPSRCGRGPLP
jgi:hypothetical protein